MLKSTEIKDNGALFYILLLKSNVGWCLSGNDYLCSLSFIFFFFKEWNVHLKSDGYSIFHPWKTKW